MYSGTVTIRPASGGIGKLESLFDLEIRQTFNFQDAAGEDVFLALLLDGQQAGRDRVVRNGIDQVAQGDAILHLALEADQHRFRHAQRHDAGGGGKGAPSNSESSDFRQINQLSPLTTPLIAQTIQHTTGARISHHVLCGQLSNEPIPFGGKFAGKSLC
jgi:hypothetical protein